MLAKIIIEMIRKSNKLELFNALCSFSSLIVNLAEVLLLTSLHLFLYFLFFSSLFFFFLSGYQISISCAPRVSTVPTIYPTVFTTNLYAVYAEEGKRRGGGGREREEREDREKKS